MDLHTQSARPAAGARAGEPPAFWRYDHFPMPLPARHRYPRSRFALVADRLAEAGLGPALALHPAAPADWELLALVHTPAYLRDVRQGTLTAQAVREIGLPFSAGLVARARAAVGATVAAAHAALAGERAGVIGGGTHHAFADRGAGYCVFNDIAVAIRDLQRRHRVERVAVVDLDVHQGNGTADIFAHDPRVLTFSIHGERNWPYRKAAGDFDLGLPDGTGDAAYLAALDAHLPAHLERFRPDLVVYQAGVDPLHSDRLGRLALSVEGLRRRDRRVLTLCADLHCPVVVTMGGGYSVPIDDAVNAHVNTLREVLALDAPPARRAAAAD